MASTRDEVAVLRDEVAELRQQLSALAAEMRAMRAGATPTAAVASVGGARQEPAVQLPPEMLQAQVQELAQVKVESGAKFPVRLSGTIVSNTVVNSGDANWLESPNIVGTASGGSMTSTMRQSRVGLDVHSIPVGAWQAKGTLIVDFMGGTPGFVTGTVMGLPRLLYAYGRLERGGTAFQAGQDHALLAPRDPTSLAAFAFPQFFRAGNLYLRAPQVRVEQRLGAFTAKAGIIAPIAGDAPGTYVFAPAAGEGERSERPAYEAHLGYGHGTADDAAELQIGVSGHAGWIKQAGALQHAAAGAFDFNARVGRLGMAGEFFTAQDLDAFGAGVAQPGRAEGGWVEARLAAARRLSFNGGAGIDRRPDGVGAAGRLRNRSAFGNVIVRLTPEVAASVEYKWLETQYASGRSRANQHVNAVFAVTF
ncbi:MAG: hypothetical protein U0P30_01450 [Vicinamibacterales bacterium]